MTGYLTPVSKQILLDHLTKDQAGSYFGLATALSLESIPTLANITEVNTPGYSRVEIDWEDATTTDPVRVVNSLDVTIGPVTEDMSPAAFGFLTTVATGDVLAPPVQAAATKTSGGSFAAGIYYWVITAYNSRGETIASNEVNQNPILNQKVTLNWATVAGASGYKIYRGTTSGVWDYLVTTITNPATTSYEDLGVIDPEAVPTSPPVKSTASVADLLYVWELSEPVRALANKPIYIPASALIIE